MRSNDRSLDLLYEVGTMRHLPRSWRQFGGEDLANVAEHSYRVAWIAMLIAQSEGADLGKVVRMALMHDLPETRTGDRNYVNCEYVVCNETQALKDTVEGTGMEGELISLWEEYEARQTIEAKVVKDADNLDCDFELQELKASGSLLPDDLAATRNRVFEKLYTDTAKQIFSRVKDSNCHSWHLNGRNRITSGDWSNERNR